MRSIYIFLAGLGAGLMIQFAVAQGNTEDDGIIKLNHVGIAVPDLDAAVTYYEEVLGFPEAFRVNTPSGDVALVYMHASEDTFVELQPANENRPAGLNHFGIQVSDMEAVRDRLIAQGADVSDLRSGSTKAILSDITDINGHRIELSEYPPDSLQGKLLGL